MKRLICPAFVLAVLSCSKSNDGNNCNYIDNNALVNAEVKLNLPEYSNLQFTSNSVMIYNQGNSAIIVTNVGSGLRAWDAVDPNHQPGPCSVMQIDGANAVCGCSDANTYSLFTGQSLNDPQPCGLKEYRVTPIGNNTYAISN